MVAALLVSVCGGHAAVGVGKQFKGPVGLQLYSLRDSFQEDVPETLNLVSDMGFKIVELAGTYGYSPKEFRALLKSHGLQPVAGHFSYDLYRDNVAKVAVEAKALGLKYAGCAWIPHEGDFDEKEAREAIEVFNRAGQALAKHGIKFFYHNHGYEFQPHGDGTLLDLMMTETDPKYVSYEMDLLWTVHPGQDPVALLEKYGTRWELLHLKDLRKGVQGDLSGGTDVRNDVTLGTGQIDFSSVLQAAKKAKVKYYFIEDESPTVKEQVPQSLKFLEQVAW
jgi:sugar phosphate isomerase/epimerase